MSSQKTQAITKRPSDDLADYLSELTAIMQSLLREGGAVTAQELHKETGVPVRVVRKILSHPDFIRRFSTLRRDLAKVEFNTIAHNTLREIVRSRLTQPKDKVSALKVWGSVLGEGSSKGAQTNINLKFDAIIRADEQARKVGEGAVVDGELVEEEFPGFE